MEYDPEDDIWFCAQGHPLTLSGIRTDRTATGYSRQTRIYHCDSCKGCPYKAQCIKGHSKVPLEERSKNLYVAPQFAQYRREATERITSDEGCLLRMNRSIQAEGSFGQLKANMNFRRFLCFGKVSVTAEITLLAIAHNIRKLHRKIQDKRTGTHLFPLKEAS